MDFTNVKQWIIPEGTVKSVSDSLGMVIWQESSPHQPNYFYVEDISGYDNTLSIRKNSNSVPTVEVFKSTDKTNWTSMGTTSIMNITATIPANGKLYLKATAQKWGGSSNALSNGIKCSGNYNIGGNIMSLLYGDNFENQTSLNNQERTFNRLFYQDTHLKSVEDLVMPATTLTNYCYYEMFRSCTGLTTAPALPATTLASYCYRGMFENCTSLTTAPALPVTTLEDSCYNSMFYGCTSLTTAPELPATTLASSCYYDMFYGCTLLTTAPELPATTLTIGCYKGMFKDCTSLTTAPELPATTLATECYSGMFYNCTSLTTAPVLPATTLTENCYQAMFSLCNNLNTVTTYASNIFASGCLTNWLNNVSAQGNFFNLGGIIYPSGESGIPRGWTEHRSL